MKLEFREHVMTLENLFYGLSTADLGSIAFQLVEPNNINHPFDKDSKMAGKECLKSFLKFQGNLSIRFPEATCITRVFEVSKQNLKVFIYI